MLFNSRSHLIPHTRLCWNIWSRRWSSVWASNTCWQSWACSSKQISLSPGQGCTPPRRRGNYTCPNVQRFSEDASSTSDYPSVIWHTLTVMPRWLTWLSSSNKFLATFPLVFIVKMFNKLRKRFMAELVWAWPSRVKLNPALHYGYVRLGSERKANWGSSNSAVHSTEISRARPPEWDPCTAAPFPASSPTAF